jgi:hypothetical protein
MKGCSVCLGRLQFGVPHFRYASDVLMSDMLLQLVGRVSVAGPFDVTHDKLKRIGHLKRVGHSACRSKAASAASCFAQLIGPRSNWSSNLLDNQLTDLTAG